MSARTAALQEHAVTTLDLDQKSNFKFPIETKQGLKEFEAMLDDNRKQSELVSILITPFYVTALK